MPTPANQGPKLQAKFGTANATWSSSTVAPASGNGKSSSADGGGTILVRSNAYSTAQQWANLSGQLLVISANGHIAWDGDPALDKRVARIIWNWDADLGYVSSWQIMLNVSLLARVAPEEYNGLLPTVGDPVVMTVQERDNSIFTDALIVTTTIVPEPSSSLLLMFSSVALFGFRRVRKTH